MAVCDQHFTEAIPKSVEVGKDESTWHHPRVARCHHVTKVVILQREGGQGIGRSKARAVLPNATVLSLHKEVWRVEQVVPIIEQEQIIAPLVGLRALAHGYRGNAAERAPSGVVERALVAQCQQVGLLYAGYPHAEHVLVAIAIVIPECCRPLPRRVGHWILLHDAIRALRRKEAEGFQAVVHREVNVAQPFRAGLGGLGVLLHVEGALHEIGLILLAVVVAGHAIAAQFIAPYRGRGCAHVGNPEQPHRGLVEHEVQTTVRVPIRKADVADIVDGAHALVAVRQPLVQRLGHACFLLIGFPDKRGFRHQRGQSCFKGGRAPLGGLRRAGVFQAIHPVRRRGFVHIVLRHIQVQIAVGVYVAQRHPDARPRVGALAGVDDALIRELRQRRARRGAVVLEPAQVLAQRAFLPQHRHQVFQPVAVQVAEFQPEVIAKPWGQGRDVQRARATRIESAARPQVQHHLRVCARAREDEVRVAVAINVGGGHAGAAVGGAIDVALAVIRLPPDFMAQRVRPCALVSRDAIGQALALVAAALAPRHPPKLDRMGRHRQQPHRH